MRIIPDTELQQLAKVISKNDLSVSFVLGLIEKRTKVIDMTAFDIELIVDYSKSLEQAIAEGNYDGRERDINAKNYPIDPTLVGKTVKTKFRLFNFDCEIVSEHVVLRINQASYQPANLTELLAFGAARPELQRVMFIKAFGSHWEDDDGYYCVPALHSYRNERRLSTVFSAHMFSPNHFALGVRRE